MEQATRRARDSAVEASRPHGLRQLSAKTRLPLRGLGGIYTARRPELPRRLLIGTSASSTGLAACRGDVAGGPVVNKEGRERGGSHDARQAIPVPAPPLRPLRRRRHKAHLVGVLKNSIHVPKTHLTKPRDAWDTGHVPWEF